ncbi:MAG: DUF61 family protein [Candidatus Thorarchaeota archaeon]
MSELIERILKREIDSINNHLPKKRVSLENLRDNENPYYETRGGERSSIFRSEIEFLLNEVPKTLHADFMVPIVVLRRIDLGPGTYSVTGGTPELFLVQRMVGQVDLQWGSLSRWQVVDRLSKPQVQQLRRRLPSATCVGFTTST